jgi:hypothetical protein
VLHLEYKQLAFGLVVFLLSPNQNVDALLSYLRTALAKQNPPVRVTPAQSLIS